MLKNFILFLIVCFSFVGFFFALKSDAISIYNGEIQTIPSVKMFGASENIEIMFSTYGMGAGTIIGLIAFILSSLIYGIFKLFKMPTTLSTGITGVLFSGSIAAFGYELVYLEERNSALASAIIHFIGRPLLYSGSLTLIVAIIFFTLSFMKKKTNKMVADMAIMAAAILCPLFLSGCTLLGDATSMGCIFTEGGKETAHCYQEAAMQKNDERVCNKAPQGDEFKQAGSNPPKDKCFYMVAQNKRDPNICDNIQGGILSYTPAECKTSVLDSAELEIQGKLNSSDSGKTLSPEELARIQKQMTDYNNFLQMMSSVTKSTHDTNASIIANLR